jgi:hypothetical protein
MTPDLIFNIFSLLLLLGIYTIIGFGPGLIVGLLIGNVIGAPRQEKLITKHIRDRREADQHNAQWSPNHKRWQ